MPQYTPCLTKFITIDCPDDLGAFAGIEGVPCLPAETMKHDAPDVHLLLLDDTGLLARCSLWWQHVPAYPGHRLGLIGHYAAQDAEAAAELLHPAFDVLAAHGCTLAVGPMDGATWRPYRFVTEPGTHPPFFLEPSHPAAYPDHFTRAGFTPLAHYHSALVPDLDALSLPLPPASDELRFRSLDLERLPDELEAIYGITVASFSDNFLYTPPPKDAFIAQYTALQPHLQPDLILIAEHDGEPAGYCFLLPDVLQARRGKPIDTVIFKTMALHPSLQGRSLGSRLAAEGHRRARDLGYRRAIHALMHETNASGLISRRQSGETMRRYTLFARNVMREDVNSLAPSYRAEFRFHTSRFHVQNHEYHRPSAHAG